MYFLTPSYEKVFQGIVKKYWWYRNHKKIEILNDLATFSWLELFIAV